MSWPLRFWIARAASAWLISTKPKPRGRPVSRSVGSETDSTVPCCENSVRTSASLAQLPPRQREVLVLRFYLDLSEPEIAAEMGIGPSTVRSTAHRALGALGRLLEEPS